MKTLKNICKKRTFSIPFLLLLATPPGSGASYRPPRMGGKQSYGVLLVAMGGNSGWDDALKDAHQAFAEGPPLAIATGYADQGPLENAVRYLEGQNVGRIVIVPLGLGFDAAPILSMLHFELGASSAPPPDTTGIFDLSFSGESPSPISVQVPVVFAESFDKSKPLVEVLAARARALASSPVEETLVLVGSREAGASGPALPSPFSSPPKAAAPAPPPELDQLAKAVGQKAGFKHSKAFAVSFARDLVVSDSIGRLRRFVEKSSLESKTAVVPAAMISGSLCAAIGEAIKGLDVAYDGRPILPDSRVTDWIKNAAKDAAAAPPISQSPPGVARFPPPLSP